MQVEAMFVFVTMEILMMGTTSGIIIEGDIYVPDDEDETEAEAFSRSQTTINVFYADRNKTWPGGIVPIYIDSPIREETEVYWNVSLAFKTVSQRTDGCIKFRDKISTDTDYVNVTRIDHGCYSAIGHRGGQQIMNIGSTCGSVGIIMHEILHVLGLWHEHSRTDRDRYIIIITSNIIPGKENNFAIHPGREKMEKAVQYDLRSIMHYKYNQFSMDEKDPTILPNISGYVKEDLGQRERITDLDVKKIGWLYNCQVVGCSSPISDNMEIKPNRPVFKNQQSATFQCKPSYNRIGVASSVCTIKESVSKWTGAVPICVNSNLVNSRLINKLLFADFEQPNMPRYGYWMNGARRSSLDTRRELTLQSMTDHTSEQIDQGHFFSFNNHNAASLYSTLYLSRTREDKISLIFFYNMYNCDDTILTVTLHWFSFRMKFGSQILWDRHSSTEDRTWYCKHVHDITEVNNNDVMFYRIQFEVSSATNSDSLIAIDDVLIGPSDEVDRFLEMQDCKTDKDTEYDSIDRLGDSGMKDP